MRLGGEEAMMLARPLGRRNLLERGFDLLLCFGACFRKACKAFLQKRWL
jgi:hypothetical protein